MTGENLGGSVFCLARYKAWHEYFGGFNLCVLKASKKNPKKIHPLRYCSYETAKSCERTYDTNDQLI